MQQFFKDHPAVRIILIALLFVIGMTLVIVGWKMTGQINGLLLMIVGVAALVMSLYIYNKIFQ